MTLNYRVPDNSGWNGRSGSSRRWETARPKTTTEVYAREQIILHERQSTEVVVQALRIGDIAHRHHADRDVCDDRPEDQSCKARCRRRW